MEAKTSLIIIISSALLTFGYAAAYTVQIHAPAVLSNENNGVLTLISLNVTSGSGAVKVIGPDDVGQDTITSAQTAAQYASAYAGVSESGYNFTYTIKDSGSNVSGPSAGLAFTILAYTALKHQSLYNNFTVTGTIDSGGNVGEVGGIYDKLSAAKQSGMNYAIVPTALGSTDPEYIDYYITQQVFNIPIVQVSTLAQALPYTSPSGASLAKPFAFNASASYYLKGLPEANVSCAECNTSYFGQLINYTFNFTSSWAGYISGNLTEARSNILQNIGTYRSIASRGYLYTGADLAFLQYPGEFVLANADNLTNAYAQAAVSNVSSYCASLTPPQLTNLNYEYVIGGELRQGWSSVTLANAQNSINLSNTTDDVIYDLDAIAPAYAWCNTAGEMYKIAAAIGGTPVGYSLQTRTDALKAIDAAKTLPVDPLYITAAESAYNQSEYGTALYGAMYSQSFGNSSTAFYNQSELSSLTISNAENSTFGIWPSQFADSALFSLYEARASGSNGTAGLSSAYTTSRLALNLNNANKLLVQSFVPVNASAISGSAQSLLENQSSEIAGINSQILQIYSLLFALVVIMAFIAIMLLILLLKTMRTGDSERAARRRR